jgi:orotate phosphoribosyltransferase
MIAKARHPELARFIDEHAIRRGRFKLSGGGTSSYYCDGKLVSFSGAGVALIAEAIIEEIGDLDIDAIGGMDMGATPIVSAVAMRLHQLGRAIPAFVVRKDVKAHGTMKAIEGPLPEKPGRVVIVDDVVTTGGSIITAVEAVRAQGHTVVLAISVLDRDAGGREALRAHGITYRPLVTIAELGICEERGGTGARSAG